MAAPIEHALVRETASGSSTSLSSDSDSSDSEERQRLREAAVDSAYPPVYKSTVGQKQGGLDSSTITELPSKRTVDVSDDKGENVLGTTPEVRAFVARKLSEKLDRSIKFCKMEMPESSALPSCLDDSGIQEGVRLFSGSKQVVYSVEEVTPKPPQRRRRKVSTSSSNSSEDERLASVAVTEEFLTQERQMLASLTSELPTSLAPVLNSEVNSPAVNHSHSHDSAQDNIQRKTEKQKKQEVCLSSVSDKMATGGANAGKDRLKKKENKKHMGGSHIPQEQSSENESVKNCEEPGSDVTLTKKKKNQKKKRALPSMCSLPVVEDCSEDENHQCESQATKKKKKKTKEVSVSVCSANASDSKFGVKVKSTGKMSSVSVNENLMKKNHHCVSKHMFSVGECSDVSDEENQTVSLKKKKKRLFSIGECSDVSDEEIQTVSLKKKKKRLTASVTSESTHLIEEDQPRKKKKKSVPSYSVACETRGVNGEDQPVKKRKIIVPPHLTSESTVVDNEDQPKKKKKKTVPSLSLSVCMESGDQSIKKKKEKGASFISKCVKSLKKRM